MSDPFPSGPLDEDVFYHGDLVCIYRAAINTWECRRLTKEAPTPAPTKKP